MKTTLITGTLVIALAVTAFAFLPTPEKDRLFALLDFDSINSFEECVDAGFAVTGDQLPRCTTDDNEVFFGTRPQNSPSASPAFSATISADSPTSTISPVAEPIASSSPSDLASTDSNSFSPTPQTSEVADIPSPNTDPPTTSFDPLASVSTNDLPDKVVLDVPFTPQAPTGNWDPPFDESCEEASVIMVERFLRGGSLSPQSATAAIEAFTTEVIRLGYPIDTTTAETAIAAEEFYDLRAKVYGEDAVTISNIKALLAAGYPVIIPAAGQLLGNPYFSGDGPPYHMLVITGYEGSDFITNDPGTRRGAGFRYDQASLVSVIHDWTGNKATIREGAKKMLVLSE